MNKRRIMTTKDIIKERIITMIEFICIMLFFFGLLAAVGYNETHYDRVGQVISIEENEIVSVKDNTGNVWAFTGTGYNIGDDVVLKMFNNCTDNIITDDEIIKVIKK